MSIKPQGKKGDKPTGKTAKSGIANEVKLDPRNPIPLELGNMPYYAINGKKYIPFLDRKDSFFRTLLDARLQSTTQNACIVTKANYTVGDGIVIRNLKDKQEPDQQWNNLMKCANNSRHSLNRVYKKMTETFLTFGNCPLEIVCGSVGGQKYMYIYVKNQLDCRLDWPDENNEVNNMIISRFFRTKRVLNLTEENCTTIPLYKTGPGNKKRFWYEDPKKKGVKRTAIWIKNDMAGYDHYGLPSYISSLVNEQMEYQGARFNLDMFENNMVIDGAIILAGNLQQGEADRLGETIIEQHTGSGKRGRTAVFSSEEGIENSKYIPFETHKDGSYIELDDKAIQKIIFANEWDAVLAGLQNGKSLGKGNGYLNEVYQQKLKTVIKPLHRLFKDSFFDPICEIADDWLGTNWKEYDIDIQTSNLFEDTTEATTTVDGINAFLNIIKLVASGAWELEAAVKFVAMRFGLSETEAAAQLGDIKLTPGLVSNNNNNPK